MYKKEGSHQWLTYLDYILLDVILMQVSFCLAFVLRHGLQNPYLIRDYLSMSILLVVLMICFGFFADSYKSILNRGYWKELKSVLILVFLTVVSLLAYAFAMRISANYSRLVMIYLVLISIPLIYLGRLVLKVFNRKKVYHQSSSRRVLLIGSREDTVKMVHDFSQDKFCEYQVVGVVIPDCDMFEQIEGINVVADLHNVINYCSDHIVDEVFIMGITNTERIVKDFYEMGITVHINLSEVNQITNNQVVEKMGDYIVLTSGVAMASLRQVMIKRVIDVLGGLIGVMITGILTIIFAPIIFISSPGPIFFTQQRVGKNGRVFTLYKFRSMYLDAEAEKVSLIEHNEMQGCIFKLKDDPRVFPFGKFMRKHSLDEFPQFFNVLKKDMSLVGTRPPTVEEYERYERRHKRRLASTPGMTGLWQTSGRSNVSDFETIVDLDTEYLVNWNLVMDLRILAKTLLCVIHSKDSF